MDHTGGCQRAHLPGTGNVCPFWLELHPFLTHYQTGNADGTCTPSGTTGEWWAATGDSDGYEQWSVDLADYASGDVEVSISYASDDVIHDFFRILRPWAQSQEGENVTTEFVRLAERISGQQLDAFFDTWLFTSERPGGIEPAAGATASSEAAGCSEVPEQEVAGLSASAAGCGPSPVGWAHGRLQVHPVRSPRAARLQ